jgi:peptidoglycan/xylan/chitin deacetylase (PgdA/CDA1 family)
MESVSPDQGNSAHVSFYRFSFFFLISLLTWSKINLDESSLPVSHNANINVGVSTPATPQVKKKKKKIYLTFDDGPNKGTRNVLDILEQENVPATFFIVGEHVFGSRAQAETWSSLQAAKNIELCNHSYSHALHNRYAKFYKNPCEVVKDVERTKAKLLPDDEIVRTPGRNSWRIDSMHFTDNKKSTAAIDSLQKAGFIVVGWDLEWSFDPKKLIVKNTADQLLAQVDSIFNCGRTRIPDNLVLLAHDQAYRSKEDSLQLREFVQKLKERDEYELSLVNTYPGIAKIIQPAKTKTPPTQ